MEKLTQARVEQWIAEGEEEFNLPELRRQHEILPGSSTLSMAVARLCDDRVIKRVGRGWYRKIKAVNPVRWWDADESVFLDFTFPRGHGGDNSEFGFEHSINLSPGDLIVLSGVSNKGKSALALNILAENVDKHKCILMGNEYTAMGDCPSPKFKRRMMAMDWMEWVNGTGEHKFELLPIRDNYEDYIQPDKINIIDWINLTDQFYKIGEIMENIKARLGKGLGVVVLQKEEDAPLGRGKGYTRDFADVYFNIDGFGEGESMLTVGKVKDWKEWITGRTWAFKIVSSGAKLHDIREVKKCPACHAKGWAKSGPCDECDAKGYVNI